MWVSGRHSFPASLFPQEPWDLLAPKKPPSRQSEIPAPPLDEPLAPLRPSVPVTPSLSLLPDRSPHVGTDNVATFLKVLL